MIEPRDDLARPPDELVREALLYASGELDGPAAARFERRLAADAAAQTALVDAVQLSLLAAGQPTRPATAYRAAVRARCVSAGRTARFRGAALARTAVASVVAASLLCVAHTGDAPATPTWPVPLREEQPGGGPLSVALAPAEATVEVTRLPPEPEPEHDMLETAREWAELSNCGDHLQRTWDEEARRRARNRERHRAGSEPYPWDASQMRSAAE